MGDKKTICAIDDFYYFFILGDKKWSPLMSMGLTKNDMGGVHGYSLFGRLKRIHVVQMGD